MKTKWKELKIGEHVYYYGPGMAKFHNKSKAVVLNPIPDRNMVHIGVNENSPNIVDRDNHYHLTAHRCQIRKIKPKEQKIKITKKQLADSWDEWVHTEAPGYYDDSNTSTVFECFANDLGFKK